MSLEVNFTCHALYQIYSYFRCFPTQYVIMHVSLKPGCYIKSKYGQKNKSAFTSEELLIAFVYGSSFLLRKKNKDKTQNK